VHCATFAAAYRPADRATLMQVNADRGPIVANWLLNAGGTSGCLQSTATRRWLMRVKAIRGCCFVLRSTSPEAARFANAQWSDTTPKLVQAKVIQALDNSNYLTAVNRPMEGLTADYQLLIDIRTFRIAAAPEDASEVEFAAKVLGKSGRIVAGKVFAAKVPAASVQASAAIAALDEAFGKAVVELVVWVANVVQSPLPQSGRESAGLRPATRR
jgi:hypothetical protein